MVLLLIYENIMRKMTVFHSIKDANQWSPVFYVNKILTCLLPHCPLFPKKQYVVKMHTQRSCPNPDTHRCNKTSVTEVELCPIPPGEFLKWFCTYSVSRIFVTLRWQRRAKNMYVFFKNGLTKQCCICLNLLMRTRRKHISRVVMLRCITSWSISEWERLFVSKHCQGLCRSPPWNMSLMVPAMFLTDCGESCHTLAFSCMLNTDRK